MDGKEPKKFNFDLAAFLRTARVLVLAVFVLGIGFRVWGNASLNGTSIYGVPVTHAGDEPSEEPAEDEPPEGSAGAAEKTDLREIHRPTYMIYYGVVDDAVIEEANQYDIVILHPKNGELTREKVRKIQAGGTYVLAYLSIGEDSRTYGLTPEQMLLDLRFVEEGTGPRVDPRAQGAKNLDGIDPTGAPSEGGAGFASYYLDDSDHDGLPDFNPSFRCAYTNMGDPAWYDVLSDMTLDGRDGVAGIREILTEDYGRGLGCDGLFLDTIDTCAPNDTSDQGTSRTRSEWTAPGASRLIERLKEEYPEKYLMQNRGIFFYNYRFPHFAFSPGKWIDFLMFESYMLDSNAGTLYTEKFFNENKYVYMPRIEAEANRPDGFRVFSLGYAEGPGEYRLKETLMGDSDAGLDILLRDIREAEDAGFSHYITDRDLTMVNHFVADHEEAEDAAPPYWTSVHNLSEAYPYEAPAPHPGIGEAEPAEGGVIVRWDVAVDKNGVDYTLYYQKAPFDFEKDPDLAAAESLTLVPDVGEGYGYQAAQEAYPYQMLVEGLDPGETYYFVIRAKDRSPEGNEERNTVTASAVPLGHR